MYLEVKMPCGETFYLSPPIGLISRQESTQWNERAWGTMDLLQRIAKERIVALATQEAGGLILCKPFEWLRWVDKIPESEPVTIQDKFAAPLRKPGRPPKEKESEE